MSDELTIMLTDRQPVRITKDDWPIIASARDWDNEHEFQANRKWKLFVRQHEDGRCIVYGIYDTQWQRESDRRHGVLIDSIDDAPSSIKSVAESIGADETLADNCIADLPAVRI